MYQVRFILLNRMSVVFTDFSSVPGIGLPSGLETTSMATDGPDSPSESGECHAHAVFVMTAARQCSISTFYHGPFFCLEAGICQATLGLVIHEL